ncbi:hypothetical protein TWF481_011315 [Arthrobotrys musiformis]|uniref:Uncharacterized protein n=1 Tax=Arthrobotrys musiformis TaxID=47236 RepID=A0AAV9W0Z1_9PEZI
MLLSLSSVPDYRIQTTHHRQLARKTHNLYLRRSRARTSDGSVGRSVPKLVGMQCPYQAYVEGRKGRSREWAPASDKQGPRDSQARAQGPSYCPSLPERTEDSIAAAEHLVAFGAFVGPARKECWETMERVRAKGRDGID